MAIKGINYLHAAVSNVAASKKFYGQALGWHLMTDEPDVAGFAFEGGYLVIVSAGSNKPNPGDLFVGIELDDVDAEHSRLKALGVEVSSISDKPWGERSFTIHDPDGYRWTYLQMRRE